MNKPKLLLVIDNLKRGGAEVLLIGILKELHERFDTVLVTLTNECEFKKNEIECTYSYSLNPTSKVSFFSSLIKLKRIIRNHKPDLIHAHLYYSSLLARLSSSANTPLIYSIHNEMSKNIFNRSNFLALVEKYTIRKNHSLIAVSKSVLTDYEIGIRKVPSWFILRNYVSDEYLEGKKNSFKPKESYRMVAIGNIKDQKNYSFLIESFKMLKSTKITLDIYGSGNVNEIELLKEKIKRHQLPINLKGSIAHPSEVLYKYDIYVSCSKYEGFGIATIEAMAMGLPIMLSNLPVYHEITFDNALFFNIEEPNSFVELINEVINGKHDLVKLSRKGIELSKEYSKQNYLKNLFNIYTKLLTN